MTNLTQTTYHHPRVDKLATARNRRGPLHLVHTAYFAPTCPILRNALYFPNTY